VYDLESDSWKEAPNLNEGRYYCTAVALNKRFIFTIGGINKAGVVKSIEKYDSFIFYSKW
jgi:N-acetylneuraminic acid mutarotase